MSFLVGILMILSGLAIMGFGLFLFYAPLPLLYGLFGLEIGLLLGRSLTGDVGLIAIILGVISAVIFAGAAYFLEPYRRILLGFSGGAVLSLSIAYLLGLDSRIGGFFGVVVLAIGGGLIGATIVPKFFDSFIITASAFGGATLVMAGAHSILLGLGLFDRAAGGFVPTLITIILAGIGVGWQFSNIAAWVRAQPLLGDDSGASTTNSGGPRQT